MIEIAPGETFESFVVALEPGLRRALAGHLPRERVADAIAEAFAFAWQHWPRVRAMEHPAGYLFRVAQSRTRARKSGFFPDPDPVGMPDVEPRLGEAMRALPPRQRSVVWLIHGCAWTYAETAEALHISRSAVGSHVSRGMAGLRRHLGVDL